MQRLISSCIIDVSIYAHASGYPSVPFAHDELMGWPVADDGGKPAMTSEAIRGPPHANNAPLITAADDKITTTSLSAPDAKLIYAQASPFSYDATRSMPTTHNMSNVPSPARAGRRQVIAFSARLILRIARNSSYDMTAD